MVGVAILAMVNGAGLAQDAGAEEANPFEDEIRAFEEQDAEAMPEPGGILFVGSSSIRMWDTDKWFPDRGIIQRGFGGSRMSDVVYFFDRIVLPYRPKAIVLYEGDNDIAVGRSAERVRDDFLELAQRIEQDLPGTELYFIAIKPSLARWDMIDEMRCANCLINWTIRDHDWMHYVDVAEAMLGPDGTPREDIFMDDGLHLNDEGYAIWTSIVEPLLAD
jgi:hypothetical protein